MANPDVAAARHAFEALLEEAANSLAERRYEEAARKVQAAANAAFLRHPGIFYSGKAEAVLGEISKACLPIGNSRRIIAPHRTPHVLHVLTQAHLPGGHTKLAQNWIASDAGSRHSVVLTQQLSQPVPESLLNSVAASNGQMWVLDENQGFIKRAGALREIAQEFDWIVLHVHPFDAIPLIAWGGSTEHAPIIHLNHADHLFWIGAAVPDLVANIRPSGYRTSNTRRGLEQAANFVLPIPLVDGQDPLPARNTAKARLNLPDDCQLALTVASSYKFNSVGEMDYVKLHLPLLDRCPRLRILVVGPSRNNKYWKDSARLTEGRIQAVGIQNDLSDYLAAADVYLDSTPFGSLTSLLEAGLAEVPCCSWRPHQSSILACDDVSFDGLRYAVTYESCEEYWEQVLAYLDDPAIATSASQELQASIIKHHINDGWRATLNEAYLLALRRAEARPHNPPNVRDIEERESDRILLAMQGGFIDNPPRPSDYFAARKKRGLLTRIKRSLKKRIGAEWS